MCSLSNISTKAEAEGFWTAWGFAAMFWPKTWRLLDKLGINNLSVHRSRRLSHVFACLIPRCLKACYGYAYASASSVYATSVSCCQPIVPSRIFNSYHSTFQPAGRVTKERMDQHFGPPASSIAPSSAGAFSRMTFGFWTRSSKKWTHMAYFERCIHYA